MFKSLPKPVKAYLSFILILFLGVVTLAAVVYFDKDASQRRERIDTLYPGPYLIERLAGDHVVFLTWKITMRGGIQNYADLWVMDIADAARYADKESAIDQAQKYGGVAVRLREVL